MKLDDFDYDLPASAIAQKPASPRDRSRLLVVRPGGPAFTHRHFSDLEEFLRPGDVLVLNDTKVIPARLLGRKTTGGETEILLLRELKNGQWEALTKNLNGKNSHNEIITMALVGRHRQKLEARPIKNIGDGIWRIKFNLTGKKMRRAINLTGQTPLPHYIKRLSNLKEYQTVFARHPGSAAAPTAGLHFTARLMNRLRKKRIKILFVTLHVGLGTFQPIRTGDVKNHKMHSELACINPETARAVNEAKREGRRVIAVGTTTSRTLESFADANGTVKAGRKEVDLFILPGYKFKVIDGLITNFHLPRTTLLLLVSAFLGFRMNDQAGGRRKLFRAYREAIKNHYRFYSFGDAMLII